MPRLHIYAHALTLGLLLLPACSDSIQSKLAPLPPVARKDMGSFPMVDMAASGLDMDAGARDTGMNSPDLLGAPELDLGDPDMCVPETKEEFCQRFNFACGRLEAVDRCGKLRVVDGQSCGMCPNPKLCKQETEEVIDEDGTKRVIIKRTSCECLVEDAKEVCAEAGVLCGRLEAPCQDIVCDEFCVESVAAGDNHNCAVGSGQVRCWGENQDKQLGVPVNGKAKNPVPLPLFTPDVSQVSAGARHTCAILQDTSLICWGDNSLGQLGVGTTVDAPAPDLTDNSNFAILKGVAKVELGHSFTCAMIDEDFDPMDPAAVPRAPYSVRCWGSNAQGQLGNNDRVAVGASAAVPTLVLGLSRNVYDLALGDRHACAIVAPATGNDPEERRIQCWGLGDSAQIGNREVETLPFLQTIPEPKLDPDTQKQEVDKDGKPVFTGRTFTFSSIAFPFVNNAMTGNADPIEPAPKFVLQSTFSLASGDDPTYQMAAQTNPLLPPPPFAAILTESTPAPHTGHFESLALGRTFSCVKYSPMSKTLANVVECWGLIPYDHAPNTCKFEPYGEPPKCSTWPRRGGDRDLWQEVAKAGAAPIPGKAIGDTVPPIFPIVSANTITLREYRGFYGGQKVPNSRLIFIRAAVRPIALEYAQSDPMLLPTGVDKADAVQAQAIAAANEHLCMLVDEPKAATSPPTRTNIYCLGHNDRGELGDGTNSPTGVPIPVQSDAENVVFRAASLSLGNRHSCAVVSDKTIKCWGANERSQIGNENLKFDETFLPFDALLNQSKKTP